MKIYIILVYIAAMDFTSDACWFLLIKNNKKREAALKNEAGGDEKRVFFTWPYFIVDDFDLVLVGSKVL